MQMPRDIGPFHIIGIGGIGMSAIAEILVAKGYTVQGSDQKESANVKRLRAKGIRVFVGHDAVNLIGARYVVISTAVKATNPELAAARARNLPIIRRAEMLAELMRLYSTVSVTGTHGKTTTTSLLSHIFTEAGLEPTVITGGIINAWGSNARLGSGKWMIVEADESDGTFTRLPTEIGIVTNIDPEHLDYFGSVEAMHHEYEMFLKNIPFFGLAVVCIDHPVVRRMVDQLGLRSDGRRMLTYGASKDADLILENVRIDGARRASMRCSRLREGRLAQARGLVGADSGHAQRVQCARGHRRRHRSGHRRRQDPAAMAGFSGVKRRFQLTGEWNGISIYDDYGHHPAEIAAVLPRPSAAPRAASSPLSSRTAIRASAISSLSSRTASMMQTASSSRRSIRRAKRRSQASIITTLANGIRAKAIARSTRSTSAASLPPMIKDLAKPGDTVVCLGAGNSTEWAHALPEWLGKRHGAPGAPPDVRGHDRRSQGADA